MFIRLDGLSCQVFLLGDLPFGHQLSYIYHLYKMGITFKRYSRSITHCIYNCLLLLNFTQNSHLLIKAASSSPHLPKNFLLDLISNLISLTSLKVVDIIVKVYINKHLLHLLLDLLILSVIHLILHFR